MKFPGKGNDNILAEPEDFNKGTYCEEEMKMGLVREVTVSEANRFLNVRFLGARGKGLEGKSAFAHVVGGRAVPRPQIAAGFGMSGSEKVSAPEVRAADTPLDLGMVAVPGTSIRAMRGEVTIEMFRQFMREKGYQPEGHNADALLRLINGSTDGNMVYLNEEDCTRFIQWAIEKTGDSTLRLPTDQEWAVVAKDLCGQLSGDTWERLADKEGQVQYFRSLRLESRSTYYFTESRFSFNGLRLVAGQSS